MGDKQKFAFDKTNFILLAIGMAVVILGFILMTGPSSSETVFQADIFSVSLFPGLYFYDIWRDAQTQNKRIKQDGMV